LLLPVAWFVGRGANDLFCCGLVCVLVVCVGMGAKRLYVAVCYSLRGSCLFWGKGCPIALFTAIGVIWANKGAILGYWLFFTVHPALFTAYHAILPFITLYYHSANYYLAVSGIYISFGVLI
jgi:hypothetical protein